MKVLFVTNMWPDQVRPWYGSFIKSQADSLRAIGVDVDVLAVRGYRGAHTYATGSGRAASLNWRAAYDLVHAHYGHSGIVGRFYLRAPLVISYCGSDLLAKRTLSGALTRRGRIEVAVSSRLAWIAAATITKSEEMERALPPARRHRNHVIPNGVDLERFRPLPQLAARERLGWTPAEKSILYVGDPAKPWKNYPLAETVRDLVSSSMPDARLRVAWELPPDDIPVCMSAADALLLTSHYEGSPNVVKEAMAAELPVVSTPVGDVVERLKGIPGCYVEPPQAETLAGALARALDHGRVPEARAAITPLGLTETARRIVSVYEEVLR